MSPGQGMLFNEAEVLTAIGQAIGTEADAAITIEEHERRKKPGKKAIPAEFPRIPVVHDIAEADKVCPTTARRSKSWVTSRPSAMPTCHRSCASWSINA